MPMRAPPNEFEFSKNSLTQKLAAIQNKSHQLYDSVYNRIAPGRYYADELADLIGAPKEPIETNPINLIEVVSREYTRDIEALAEITKNDDLNATFHILGARNIQVQNARAKFQERFDQVNSRVNTKKKELRAAQ